MQTQYDNVVRMDGAIAVEQANKVLRNTYLMLGLTMIPTVIGAYFGMSLNFAFAAEHPFMFAIGMLAVMMGLFFGINATRDSGTSTSEMSCEVENIATAPRSSPRKNSMMKRDTP